MKCKIVLWNTPKEFQTAFERAIEEIWLDVEINIQYSTLDYDWVFHSALITYEPKWEGVSGDIKNTEIEKENLTPSWWKK